MKTIIVTAILLAISSTCMAWEDFWPPLGGQNKLGDYVSVCPMRECCGDSSSDKSMKDNQDIDYDIYCVYVYKGGKISENAEKIYKDQRCKFKTDKANKAGEWIEFSCEKSGKSPLSGVTYKIVPNKNPNDCSYYAMFICIKGCNPLAPERMKQDHHECEEEEPKCYYERKYTDVKIREEIFVRDRPSILGRIVGKYSGNTKVKILKRDNICKRYSFIKDGAVDGQWIKVENISDKSAVSGWIFDYYVEYSDNNGSPVSEVYTQEQVIRRKSPLRFDGIYRSEKIGNSYWEWARFYEDGTVITVLDSMDNPVEIFRWFKKENLSVDMSRGYYEIKGSRIVFSSTSKSGTVDYEGTIQKNTLILNSSHRSGHQSKKIIYRFVQL